MLSTDRKTEQKHKDKSLNINLKIPPRLQILINEKEEITKSKVLKYLFPLWNTDFANELSENEIISMYIKKGLMPKEWKGDLNDKLSRGDLAIVLDKCLTPFKNDLKL